MANMTRMYIIRASYSERLQNCDKRFFGNPDKALIKTLKRSAKTTTELTSELKAHGFKTGYVKDSAFPSGGYEEIYKYIASCDCTLVFTDGMTFDKTSQTRRSNELTYAILTAAHPVFLYTALDGYYNESDLFKGVRDLPNVYPLADGTIKQMAQFIANTMQNYAKGT